MDPVRFDETKPAELCSVLRRFVLACNERSVWEGKALYLVGSFLTGAAATRFNKILHNTAGNILGRTVASCHEAVRRLLAIAAHHPEASRVRCEPSLSGRP